MPRITFCTRQTQDFMFCPARGSAKTALHLERPPLEHTGIRRTNCIFYRHLYSDGRVTKLCDQALTAHNWWRELPPTHANPSAVRTFYSLHGCSDRQTFSGSGARSRKPCEFPSKNLRNRYVVQMEARDHAPLIVSHRSVSVAETDKRTDAQGWSHSGRRCPAGDVARA